MLKTFSIKQIQICILQSEINHSVIYISANHPLLSWMMTPN